MPGGSRACPGGNPKDGQGRALPPVQPPGSLVSLQSMTDTIRPDRNPDHNPHVAGLYRAMALRFCRPAIGLIRTLSPVRQPGGVLFFSKVSQMPIINRVRLTN